MKKLNNDELDYLIKYLENREQYLCDSIMDSMQQLSNWLTYDEIMDSDDQKELKLLNSIYIKINSMKLNNNKNSSDRD